MRSKAQEFMEKILEKLCKKYKIPLLKEIKEGNKRYDFYIPTSPPLVIEVNGKQHEAVKVDNFFFKDSESLAKYKRNDFERKSLSRRGYIILFNFTDKDFPNFSDLEELLGPYLSKGVDENNAYYKTFRKNREYIERKKEYFKRKRIKTE